MLAPTRPRTRPPVESDHPTTPRKRKIIRRAVIAMVAGVAVFTFILLQPAIALGLGFKALDTFWDGLPSLPQVLAPPPERSTVVDAEGNRLAVLHGDENRVTIPYDQMPQVLIDAVVSTEDRDFFEHEGIDYRAIVRAVVANHQAGTVRQGGSTITQQVAKLTAAGSEQSLQRKVSEMKIAFELEGRMDKTDLLALYLNKIYLGRGVYGVETASRYYFSKPASKLTLAEAATLAGVIRSPEGNNPVTHPRRARERRNIVLGQMAETGAITAFEARRASREKLELRLNPLPPTREPAFVEQVKAELLRDPALGETVEERRAAVLGGGLHIQTTLEPDKQQAAREALGQYLTDPTWHPMGAVATVVPGDGRVVAVALGPKEYGTCTKRQERTDTCDKTTVNPAVAGLGGSGRPAGSAFKPFVSATTLSHGITSQVGMDTPSGAAIPGCSGWYPGNYSDGGGGFLDLYGATRVSSNVYFARLIGMIGPEAVGRTARGLGITSAIPDNCAIALGGVDVFPLDMANAYATLGAAGRHCPAYTVAAVNDRDGNPISLDRDCDQSLDEGVAKRITDTLRGPLQPGGTAGDDGIARPAAGKTGTTQDYHDAWFVGYTAGADGDGPPKPGAYSTAVWLGYETPRPLLGLFGVSTMTGGSVPAAIWSDYMAEITAGTPKNDFAEPPSEIVSVPEVVGDQVKDAREELAGVPLRVEAEEVRHWKPEGEVLTQTPYSGATAAYLSEVNLTYSNGKAPIPRVPDIVGLDKAEAMSALDKADYYATVVEKGVQDPKLFGTVLSQNPEGRTIMEKGGTVTVTVAVDGRPRMPDVLKQSESSAQSELGSAGYEVSVEYVKTLNGALAGLVVEQSPSPGSIRYPKNGPVSVTVAVDARPVVPDVTGLDASQAQKRVAAAGFEPELVERGVEDPNLFGRAIDQEPGGGSHHDAGARVSIAVAVEGRPVVPDVVGETRSDAVDALRDAGYRIERRRQETTDQRWFGRVVEQSVPAGTRLARRSVVVITIAVDGRPPPQEEPEPEPEPPSDEREPPGQAKKRDD